MRETTVKIYSRCVLGSLIGLILLSSTAFAQLLNNPESVAYDPLRNCHYVSNWGDGRIVKVDSLGEQSIFNSDMSRVAGEHQLEVKANNWASGTYFLQLRANNSQSVNKITLLK